MIVMSAFSLDPEMNIQVIARFITKGNNQPVSGADYTVRLFDKDIIANEFLGESGLDGNGYAKISFLPSAFSNIANLETFPDLYFALYKNGDLVYKSPVMTDVNLAAFEQYKKGEGEVIDLGTYLLEV